MSKYLAQIVDPSASTAWLCYEAPGLTEDKAKATRFTSEAAAYWAARAAVWGDPGAFWPSERASAEKVAASRGKKGWTFLVCGEP